METLKTGFLTGVYFDQDNNRQRWAVIGPRNVWYFPKKYGRKAAHSLCKRLNKSASSKVML